jgi:hypothetical protein
MKDQVPITFLGETTLKRMAKTHAFQLSRMIDEILYAARETDCDYESSDPERSDKVWAGWIVLGPKDKYISKTEIPEDVQVKSTVTGGAYFDTLAALRAARDYLELIALKEVT